MAAAGGGGAAAAVLLVLLTQFTDAVLNGETFEQLLVDLANRDLGVDSFQVC